MKKNRMEFVLMSYLIGVLVGIFIGAGSMYVYYNL